MLYVERAHFSAMAIECPYCRCVTSNDDAPCCAACGRVYKQIFRYADEIRWIAVSLVIGLVLTIFVLQRGC